MIGGERGSSGDSASVDAWSLVPGEPLLRELSIQMTSPYRIWRKCRDGGLRVDQLQLKDFFGVVVIAPSVPACYQALGAIHSRYRSCGEMRDYISTPKPNRYQSLHTTVIGPSTQQVALAIRTPRMHTLAETGVVTLWQTAGLSKPWASANERHARWLSSLRGISETTTSADDYIELTQMELFPDQLFCLTPRGDTVALPRGGTPLDFAYAIHSRVGHTCSRAVVNGVPRSLYAPLRNGDLVEIVTDATAEPAAEWEVAVVSGKARAEIRRFLNAKRRGERAALGRTLLRESLGDAGLARAADAALLLAARALPQCASFRHVADLELAVADGRVPLKKLIAIVRRNEGRAGAARRQAATPTAASRRAATSRRAARQGRRRPPRAQRRRAALPRGWTRAPVPPPRRAARRAPPPACTSSSEPRDSKGSSPCATARRRPRRRG